jgi:hypothetical protein
MLIYINLDSQKVRGRRNWPELPKVGDDDPTFVVTNNAFAGQLPEQPTEMFGRNPYETGEIAMREWHRDAKSTP